MRQRNGQLLIAGGVVLGAAVLLAGVALSHTGSGGSSSSAKLSSGYQSPAGASIAAVAPAAAGAATTGAPTGLPDVTAGASVSIDRKIVRNGDIAVQVADAQRAADSVSGIATGLGGYVAKSDLTERGGQLGGSITIRVPAEQFDAALSQIKQIGLKVERQNVTSQDVTEEYADLDARIKNLQATADQFRLLLDTVRQKSNSAADIIAVYKQLSDIQGQIEQAQGRQQALDKLSTLATLAVQLDPKPVGTPSAPSSWRPAETVRAALNALGALGQLAVVALIWLGIVVLPLAVLLGVLYMLVRRLQRLRAGRGGGPLTPPTPLSP